MPKKNSAEEISAAIASTLSQHDLSEAEKQKIREIVESSLIDTIEATTDHNLKTTVNCCGPEADLAHQIRHEVNLKKKVLIANLLGPR